MTDESLVREEACSEARTLKYSAPRAELLADYLGHGGEGKTSTLEYHRVNQDPTWALAELDGELTALAKSLTPLTGEALGFRCTGRRKGLVWRPFSDSSEAQVLRPEPLSDEDVDAGVLDSHLHFIQERRLCLMRWIHNSGGELELFQRLNGAAPNSEPTRLPLSSGKLLVFRCDQLGFSYRPTGTDAVSLMTWVMDDSSEAAKQLATGYFATSDAMQLSEALGIMVGPPMPTGHRMHIMAMHAHVPGGVLEMGGFECMLATGTDGFVKIPIVRFDTDVYCTNDGEKEYGKSYVIHGGMLGDAEITTFDNKFFGISSEEVMTMSPQQRVILEDGYTCLVKAGLNKKTLMCRQTAAFLGDTGTDWDFFAQMKVLEDPQNPDKPIPFGNVAACHLTYGGVSKIVSAGRLSHIFGLRGSTTAIDTACSASLVGVASAVHSMRRAEGGQVKPVADKHNVDAICMGINLLTSPMPFIGLCGPSMLAKDGRCFTFNASAQGYARGDGFGAAYIKPSDSEEDNMNQLACLMGVFVNQDGRSATLTAPNGMAQQACVRSSMREAGVTASQITIGECHGTGTALGDPIEVGALRGVMEPRETPLLTTSAKSNIGHLEACAGMVGLIKCVTMVAMSNATPNCHLRDMNPHLDVDGFPAYFESESVETRLNSNYAGVSSFGFSGTNAREDLSGQCKKGPRKAAQKVDVTKADQIHRRCPITLGHIELVTGEPATAAFKKKRDYKADVLRDEWAPYDISRLAYEGGFRYRRAPAAEEQDEELDPNVEVFICGSWSGWTRSEAMERREGGLFVAPVVLGEGRYEMFRLCLNNTRTMELYPTIKDASEKIWIEGPDSKANRRYWIIDGRDLQVAAGTAYQVLFRWHSEVKSIRWEEIRSELPPMLPAFEHRYALTGTFSSGHFLDMKPAAEGQHGVWEGRFRVGVTGEEEFQIARDSDPNQLIYPAMAGALRTTIPVRGPDSLGKGKFWLIRGMPNEVVRIRLEIADAHVAVTTSSEVRGDKVWESLEGWDRHQYCVVGSWSGWVPAAMVMDPAEPGLFKAYGKVGKAWSHQHGAYIERFQVAVDGDSAQAFHPQLGDAAAAESIVDGPDDGGAGKSWLIRSQDPNVRFEICLNLNAADRRQKVTWSWTEPLALSEGQTQRRALAN
ncbi:unnamed protein product [Polarella glacialis]|uniref:Ketosynthase family 3 (KS3) domain-containing protein n=1 Tax=Polarella glacialis TaxID=89957 RepID=A0A813JRH9_POLGL|nr:unnamed protein product [Polarella glacialis]